MLEVIQLKPSLTHTHKIIEMDKPILILKSKPQISRNISSFNPPSPIYQKVCVIR